MLLVLDSSVLITLARIGRLGLLREVSDAVYIPEAARDEVVAGGREQSGTAEIAGADWIVCKQPREQDTVQRLREQLGRGEAEAIALSKEFRANFLVMDDATARRVAEAEGVKVVGLLGLLIHRRNAGLLVVSNQSWMNWRQQDFTWMANCVN